MRGKYTLDGRRPILCEDLIAWGRWLETADLTVSRDYIGPFKVSTVFLGLDHNFGRGNPLLFETMIFFHGGDLPDGEYQVRTETWEQAEKAHAEAVEIAKGKRQ